MPHAPDRDRWPLLAPLAVLAAVAVTTGCGATRTVMPIGDPPETATAPPPSAPATAAPPTPTAAPTTAPPPTAPTAPPIATAPAATGPATASPPRPAAERPPPARPRDFPNSGERHLLARLPAPVRPRCTREPAGSRAEGAVAGIACELHRRAGVRAYYELFPTTAATEAAYGGYRRANGVPLERGGCAMADGRRPPLPAEEAWTPAAGGDPTARRMCFVRDGAAWMVAALPAQRVMAFISGSRYGAVSGYWNREGQPTPP